ncbi:ABC transporter permease, partial [Enterococcus hirae]
PLFRGLRRIDLLFVPALVLFTVYGVVPLATEPSRARPVWNAAKTRPLVAFSLLWLAGFVVVGLVGPLFIDLSFDLDATH